MRDFSLLGEGFLEASHVPGLYQTRTMRAKKNSARYKALFA
jgi:hypothetical protein